MTSKKGTEHITPKQHQTQEIKTANKHPKAMPRHITFKLQKIKNKKILKEDKEQAKTLPTEGEKKDETVFGISDTKQTKKSKGEIFKMWTGKQCLSRILWHMKFPCNDKRQIMAFADKIGSDLYEK